MLPCQFGENFVLFRINDKPRKYPYSLRLFSLTHPESDDRAPLAHRDDDHDRMSQRFARCNNELHEVIHRKKLDQTRSRSQYQNGSVVSNSIKNQSINQSINQFNQHNMYLNSLISFEWCQCTSTSVEADYRELWRLASRAKEILLVELQM
jgi:hypothetical protein